MTLGILNFLVLQWFGIRVGYWHGWVMYRWVWPLVGWRSGRIHWIGRQQVVVQFGPALPDQLGAVALATLMAGSGLGLALLCACGAP